MATLQRLRRRSTFGLPVVHLLFCVPAFAQSTADPGKELAERLDVVGDIPEQSQLAEGHSDGASSKAAKPDLLIVPVPHSSPSLGFGITVGAALFYNPNQAPQPWISGAGAMYNANGSWGVAAIHKMSLDGDRLRASAFAGYADINVKFYGIGPAAGDRNESIGINDRGLAIGVGGQMRVADNLFVGARFQYIDLSSSLSNDEPLFPDLDLPEAELHSRLSQIGPEITFDRRDDSLYPTTGELASAVWLFGIKALGSDFDHNKFTIAANAYRSVSPGTVVAARASLCGVSTLAPFYDLCLYGSGNDLRGYETGRYRDRGQWAAQIELRQHLFGRFAATAFVGVGESMPTPTSFGDGKFLPAAGFGLRFRPSKQTPVNLRVDFAVGKHSNAIHLGVGEAF